MATNEYTLRSAMVEDLKLMIRREDARDQQDAHLCLATYDTVCDVIEILENELNAQEG